MKTDEVKLSNTAQIYEREFQFLEMLKGIEANGPISKEELLSRYLVLGKEYKKLLKKTIKMTTIGDATQKKLLMANEQIQKQQQQLSKAYKKMETLARTDPLTKLSNRRDYLEKFNLELNRFERNKIPFSVVLCDIDDFKLVNDEYGHDCGDFVLVGISELMTSTVRKQDVVGRWGGEEFILLLPETSIAGGNRVAEGIRKNLEDKTFFFNGKEIAVTMTFGASQYDGTMDIDACIKKADEALYSGKRAGKNRVHSALLPENKKNKSTF